MGEDGRGEGRGRGGDFGVYGDEPEERLVHVGAYLGGVWRSRRPGGGGDGCEDQGRELIGNGTGVGVGDLGVDLGEDVTDGFRFVAEANGEVGFELVDQVRDDFRLEGFEVAECEEKADALCRCERKWKITYEEGDLTRLSTFTRFRSTGPPNTVPVSS